MKIAGPTFALMLAATAASAQQSVPFDGSWEEQGFLRLSSNDYAQEGRSLGIRSDGTVSILYRRLPEAGGSVQGASWSWEVATGVPATDLTRKGGDDRNIAIYFLFADPETAASLRGQPLRRLLSASGVRVLTYVWGGSAERGATLPNPYLEGSGTTVVLRGAGPDSTRKALIWPAISRQSLACGTRCCSVSPSRPTATTPMAGSRRAFRTWSCAEFMEPSSTGIRFALRTLRTKMKELKHDGW